MESELSLNKQSKSITKKREVKVYSTQDHNDMKIGDLIKDSLSSYNQFLLKNPSSTSPSQIDSSDITLECNIDSLKGTISLRAPKEEPYKSIYFKTQEHIHPFFTTNGEENLLNYFPHSPFLVKQENNPTQLSTDLILNRKSLEGDLNGSNGHSSSPLNEDEDVKVLIFSPHQDDEVLGTASLISKLITENIPFRVIYMTSGKGGGNTEVRKREAIAGVTVLGGSEKNCVFHDFPFYTKENRIVTEKDYEYMHNLFSQYKPTSIFICSDVFDPNYSHRKCYDILLHYLHNYKHYISYKDKNIEEHPKSELIYKEMINTEAWTFNVFFYYSVWYWPKENEISHALFYDFNVYKKKVCSMMEHVSQIENKFMGADERPFYERATHRDKWFGSKYGKNYSEIFHLVNQK